MVSNLSIPQWLNKFNRGFSFLLLAATVSACNTQQSSQQRESVSGIYPKLAFYNDEGECGTGAVVPWNNSLWVITYGPHKPKGSSDKLYEITPDFKQIVFDKSIGGTPANRMIHRESNQLFIGPYAIDSLNNVRVIPYSKMPGRHTANARHLTNPEDKIMYATMEEGFYIVDVKTLKVDTIYIDGNSKRKKKGQMALHNDLLPGAHGKGFYSGQGVAVFSNNGEASKEALERFDAESGSLSEWNGKDWKVIRRNQFVEVTGPGGIYGNDNPETDPIWATGWDHKSVLLGVRDAKKGWKFFRLPKASHSYDGAHGWNTEWPRIRNVGTEGHPDYLMTMHGMFWSFPSTFTIDNTAGIRPRSAYLKVIGDFTRWNDQLVFGCDDSAQKEFLNTRKAKGCIEGPGQSNSNLWFTSLTKPSELGPSSAEGTVWANETITANEYSDPMLFAGWSQRCVWIKNDGNQATTFVFEVDDNGQGNWRQIANKDVKAGESALIEFETEMPGEWIRVKPLQNTKATISFNYASSDTRATSPDKMFDGLASTKTKNKKTGLLYGLGNNRRALGLTANGNYYELDENLVLSKKDDPETQAFINEKFAIPQNAVSIEESSILIIDDKNRRWRLPLGEASLSQPTLNGDLRLCREVATERDLFSCMGTFYELPAENADGYAKIRPIATHPFMISDYASYRGMLVMTGIEASAKFSEHIIVSDDNKAAVWVGAIDDLWTLGKPVGHGGPWSNTAVKANVVSDPYLFGFYDQRLLSLSHHSPKDVNFDIELDPTGNGDWMTYKTVCVKSGETSILTFPDNLQARWIRFKTDADANATALLEYK